MNPVHSNFDILLEIKNVINRNVVYISDLTPDRSKWVEWIPSKMLRLVCFQMLTSLELTKVVLKSRKAEVIFIFEHKPQYSLLLYITCILKNVPVFFMVHGIQQAQKKSIFHYWGVEVLRMLVRRGKFWPIHLEMSDSNVSGVKNFFRSIVIPHPIAKESGCYRKVYPDDNKILIGIAGMIRPDKPISKIIRIVLEYIKRNGAVQLIVGTPFWQELPDELKQSNIHLVDTTSKGQYFNFLKTLDIVIADFERDAFYFRPSGIINDAVSCGCFVIAPDFPVFKAQLSYPVKVGETYQSIVELDEVISRSISYIKNNRVDFDSWRKARESQFIIDALGRSIEDVIGQRQMKSLDFSCHASNKEIIQQRGLETPVRKM